MIRIAIACVLTALPAFLPAQGMFEIPSSGEVGYRDLSPLRVTTLLQGDESPELLLLHGPEAVPVSVTLDLIANENGRIGGMVSLSWIGDDDRSRLLELPASGRLRMHSRSTGVLSVSNGSRFHYEWDKALDVRASLPGAGIRIVGSSAGESSMDPTLSREWTLDLTSRLEGLGSASARAHVLFGNEASARFVTTEGIFGAENTQLHQWSGDAHLVSAGGERIPGGSMAMETRYMEPEENTLGGFLIRAQNGQTRTTVSGWLPTTYDEAAFAVASGTFDFATLDITVTNRLFATPAFTTHERFRWDDDFWDRSQVGPPLLDR